MRNVEGSLIDESENFKSPATRHAELGQYLQEYLELDDTSGLEIIGPDAFPEQYRDQYDFLNDERLKDVQVVIVPRENWPKGSQPSESHAEKGLVLFVDDYFQGEDPAAWLTHELSHCAKFRDSDQEGYQRESDTPAFEDLAGEVSYPNNLVEQHAFTKQFEFLKQQGVKRAEVTKMLEEHYGEEDKAFFDRLLDTVYS